MRASDERLRASTGEPTSSRLAMLRARVFLLRRMVARDVSVRFAGTRIGMVWSLVQPLVMLALYTFVFQYVYRVGQIEGRHGFAAFVFCALWPWMAFQEGTMRAVTAVVDNAGIVKKLKFPSELFVVSVALSSAITHGVGLALFVALFQIVGDPGRPAAIPLLAVPITLQLALTVGLGMLLACAQVFVRDVAQMAAPALTVWFFLSPIVYAEGMVPARMRPLFDLNPMTPIIRLYRAAILGTEVGALSGLLYSTIVAVLLLAAGRAVFARCRPFFADYL
jgi:lipopolysaccharide transport system permease protein